MSLGRAPPDYMSSQQQQQQDVDWNEILSSVPYPIEAFAFVREGLNYAVEAVHEDSNALPEDERHLTGQPLCRAVRALAIPTYGPLAPLLRAPCRLRPRVPLCDPRRHGPVWTTGETRQAPRFYARTPSCPGHMCSARARPMLVCLINTSHCQGAHSES